MINHLHHSIKIATTLTDISKSLILSFEQAKKEKNTIQIGYVSGIITSEGPEHIQRNILLLKTHAQRLREIHSFPIISAPDIFTSEVPIQIDSPNIPYQDWIQFWRDVLRSGYITDIFMTPRWEKSTGAKDEFQIANEEDMTIHYIS